MITTRTISRPLVAAALLLAPALSARADEKEEFGRLTVEQVGGMLRRKDVHVFDNNPKDVWAAGHVPGAKWVKYSDVKAGDLPARKDATLIFYCASEQ